MALKIEDYIASVRDFPIKGILFRDITPILENAEAFREVTNRLCDYAKSVNADMIVGPESRGFILAVQLRLNLDWVLCLFVSQVSFLVKQLAASMN